MKKQQQKNKQTGAYSSIPLVVAARKKLDLTLYLRSIVTFISLDISFHVSGNFLINVTFSQPHIWH